MIKLFISTFGERVEWIKCKWIIPIEVGAVCRPESTIHYSVTDSGGGSSITHLNPFFGELSGLYWIWKNYQFDEDDIIGFAHYNKVLDISSRKLEKLLSDNKAQWIVRDPIKLKKHSYEADIKVLESVLREDFDTYYSVWQDLYYPTGESKTINCYYCQMFYTTVDEFNNYCEFLFGVLLKVYEKIGEVDREPYHKRYCAFLGERLLSVYLLRNKRNVYIAPIDDRANRLIRTARSVYRRIGLDKNPVIKGLAGILRKGRKRQSSYLKND